MSHFKENLKKNNFVCSFCPKCNKTVWPPSDFCNSCFSEVVWKTLDRKAKLIEMVKKDEECICLAEFESGIRIMGVLQNWKNLKIGDLLNLAKCDYDQTEKFILEPFHDRTKL